MVAHLHFLHLVGVNETKDVKQCRMPRSDIRRGRLESSAGAALLAGPRKHAARDVHVHLQVLHGQGRGLGAARLQGVADVVGGTLVDAALEAGLAVVK
jgi:hypothetical protein